MNAPDALHEFKNHDPDISRCGDAKRPARTPDGWVAIGLRNAWLALGTGARRRTEAHPFNPVREHC